MAEYTKGEWRASHPMNKKTTFLCENGHHLLGTMEWGISDPILQKANARLISQAPRMAEAIKHFVNVTNRAKGVEFSPSMVGAYIALKEVLALIEEA